MFNYHLGELPISKEVATNRLGNELTFIEYMAMDICVNAPASDFTRAYVKKYAKAFLKFMKKTGMHGDILEFGTIVQWNQHARFNVYHKCHGRLYDLYYNKRFKRLYRAVKHITMEAIETNMDD